MSAAQTHPDATAVAGVHIFSVADAVVAQKFFVSVVANYVPRFQGSPPRGGTV